jgi:hypothetical protein
MRTTLVFDPSPPKSARGKSGTIFRERLREFLFAPDSDTWLALLRIGLGFQVTLYCLSLRSAWNHLFAGDSNGFIGRDLTEALLTIDSPFAPRLGWLVNLGSHLGLGEETTLFLAWAFLLCAGCFLLFGLFCRPSAAIAWFLHLCAVKSGNFVAYGMDNFTTIGLFYLMVAPLPDHHALDWKFWKPQSNDPGMLGFHRRVLQLHLCIIYFFGGITKCLGAGWWTGESMWRALTRPPFHLISTQILVSWQPVLPFLGIAVCLLETGFPILIWFRKTRLIWLVCVLGMHVAIGLTMGLYLFALIMIVLDIAAFGPGVLARQSEKSRFCRQEAIA